MFQHLRRVTRFTLALLIWLHTFLVLGFTRPDFSSFAARLQLTVGETVIFGLLLFLSVLASYGYGRVLIDLLYIYCFPFVLLFLCVKWTVLGLRLVHRLLSRGMSPETTRTILAQSSPVIPGPATSTSTSRKGENKTWRKIGEASIRPFRRFTVLWCLLLLLTKHKSFLELALAIVAIHICFGIVAILQLTLSSAGILSKAVLRITKQTEEQLAKILQITPDTQATPDLQNVWNSLTGIRLGLRFLRNRQLVSRWAIFLGTVFLACVYTYIGFLFSFVYYGVARLESLTFAWPDALVTSLFIPFAFTTLPHSVWLKLIAGIHCTIVLAVGTGTLVNYLTRQAQELQGLALSLGAKFDDADVSSRLTILEDKFKVVPGSQVKP